jgi:hypothetical protein
VPGQRSAATAQEVTIEHGRSPDRRRAHARPRWRCAGDDPHTEGRLQLRLRRARAESPGSCARQQLTGLDVCNRGGRRDSMKRAICGLRTTPRAWQVRSTRSGPRPVQGAGCFFPASRVFSGCTQSLDRFLKKRRINRTVAWRGPPGKPRRSRTKPPLLSSAVSLQPVIQDQAMKYCRNGDTRRYPLSRQALYEQFGLLPLRRGKAWENAASPSGFPSRRAVVLWRGSFYSMRGGLRTAAGSGGPLACRLPLAPSNAVLLRAPVRAGSGHG